MPNREVARRLAHPVSERAVSGVSRRFCSESEHFCVLQAAWTSSGKCRVPSYAISGARVWSSARAVWSRRLVMPPFAQGSGCPTDPISKYIPGFAHSAGFSYGILTTRRSTKHASGFFACLSIISVRFADSSTF